MISMWAVALASALAAQAPPPVAPGEVRVATSALHTLVIAPDGRVLCQGRNQHAVCGIDPATAFVETLSEVPGIPKGRAVAVADIWTSMVLGVDGRVYVWGQNNSGLLGGTDRGPTFVRLQPSVVPGLDRVIGIAAFVHGGAALRDDGTVWSWGANRYAQLGTGDTTARAVPTQITALTGVTRIYANAEMSAARQADGSWLVWGAVPSMQPPTKDAFGGILSDMPSVLTPSPLPGTLRDATGIASGAVVFRDGTVRTWGSNSFGTLGTGGSVDAVAPRGVLVRSLSGITQVWAGGNRVLALKSDGTLYLWGPAGTKDDRVLRVPTVMTTFAPAPQKQ